jgi:hypothetical protein
MVPLAKKLPKTSNHLIDKIQQLKEKQHALETKMVQQLHRALKIHHGFTIPFPALLGGLMDVMEQANANSHQAEVWKVSGEKFLRQRTKRRPQILPSKNSPAVSLSPTAMETSHDQT